MCLALSRDVLFVRARARCGSAVSTRTHPDLSLGAATRRFSADLGQDPKRSFLSMETRSDLFISFFKTQNFKEKKFPLF